ncbi:MAG: phage/plasmid primase, P4 family [Hyphomicrobium sp.]
MVRLLIGNLDVLSKSPPGEQNDALNKAAYACGRAIARREIQRKDAAAELFAAAKSIGYVDRDGEAAAKATIKSGLDAGDRDERTRAAAEKDEYPFTDDGNARRLIDHHGFDLRYCEEQGIWYAWNGRRWAPSKGVAVERRAKNTARAFHRAELDAARDANAPSRKWALRSEGAPQILNMVRLARSEESIAVEIPDLDADPWLFGCLNGVLNTRTGDLLPHDRKYLITKIAPVVFDPTATFELWNNFIDAVTDGNPEQQEFLQRAVGCSLTAEPADDDRFFFIHGPPGGGKTTFIEAVLAALGRYGQAANFDMLLNHSNVGGTRPDLVRLRGARFVSVADIPDGKRLDEKVLKQLTGGDTIAAHAKYQDEIEFTAVCKLWVAGNHEPIINDGDSAVWRRILKVPFTHVIPEGTRDPTVKATLRSNPAARAAVLAWAFRGCQEWQRQGLAAPESVKIATAEYQERQDLIQQFMAECCDRGAGLEMELGEGYKAFNEWCRNSGIYRPDTTRTRFTQRVKTILSAPEIRKSGSRRYVTGIDLQAEVRAQGRLDAARDEHKDGPDGSEAAGF